MIFRKRNEEPLETALKNQIIIYKECTQFLGRTIDRRLNWNEHIDRV